MTEQNNVFILGQTVVAKNLGWEGNGTTEYPLRRVDVKGVITSVKGVSPKHTSIYKYEFTWKGGKMYTNGIAHNQSDLIGELKVF